MASVAPSPQPNGNTGPQSKVIAWTSFVVDTRTSKVYSVANGGHNDYAGNEVDELDLEREAPVWTQKLAPTPNAQLTSCQSYYADGRPTSRHTYYGITYNEFDNRIMLFGGAYWCVNGGGTSAISSYNIGSNQYSSSSTHGNLPGAFVGGPAFAVNPATGDAYALADFVLGRWTRSTNTFSQLSPSGSVPAGGEAMSAMDTSRGRILFVGGLNSAHHLYTLASNSFGAITLTGPNAGSLNVTKGAMVYVPALDRFLVRLSGSGGTVYQVHPTTFEVTTVATTGGGSVPSTQNGPFNKFLYVPRLGGAVYVPSHSGNSWFLKLH
jgi:hypothetical protein